jgi:hypothetical protein
VPAHVACCREELVAVTKAAASASVLLRCKVMLRLVVEPEEES